MDTQPETVPPVPSNAKSAASAIANQRRKETVRAASAETTGPCGGSANSESRISIDPMRATDRYRLVMPYSPRF